MRLSRISDRFIQIEVSVLRRSEAEADNADRGLNNSDIVCKPNSIILLLFRIFKFSESLSCTIFSICSVETEAKQAEAAEAIVKTK